MLYDDYESWNRSRRWKNVFVLAIVAILLASMAYVGFLFIKGYNSLIDMQEDVKLANANVQVMMQRRLELIPDLVETVKKYSDHEEKVFKDIADARTALATCLDNGDTEKINEANAELSRQINNLISVVNENYPDLKSGEQYTSLMDQLEGSVNRISVARDAYNNAVSEYNRTVKKFPGFALAKMFGFEEIEPFAADEEAERINMVNWN